MYKKILILGSSSFSGSTFVDFLLKKKFKVYGCYRNKKNSIYLPFKKNSNIKNLKEFKLDFLKNSDTEKLVKLIKKIKPEIIIDFASICMVQESWKYPDKYFLVNVISKTMLLKKIYEFSFVKKFIYVSTPEIFGSSKKSIPENFQFFFPSTPYATSKLSAELLIKNYNKNYVKKGIITRFSNFYGPGQPNYRLIPKLLISIKKGKKFPVDGNGQTKRNFIFSKDFSEGLFKTLKSGKPGETYHFSSKNIVSIIDIIKLTCKLMKVTFSKVVFYRSERKGKDKVYRLSSAWTSKRLNWKSKTPLKNGIKSMIDFTNQNYKHLSKYPLDYKN